ncbi:MAG TPA: carboxypeptidase-like regulatory domain-containing protein [Pyrinomonadaceae bacterium]|nr:carboxypeptidase-like regulatory domain-containing protein [Pyrinomonadaceae bacterium]
MTKERLARFRSIVSALFVATAMTAGSLSPAAFAQATPDTGPVTPPQYQIFDIGVVAMGDSASQGFGVSNAGIAVGRSVRTGAAQAFTWTQGGGIVGLPNIAGRAFCVSNGANDNAVVVGTCAATLFGTNRLPVIWQAGAVSQLPLPAGETLGDANDVNTAGVAVGSINAGSLQRAAVYSGNTATVITQTTSGGSFFVTAFGVNDSGRVVGQGIDPNNAARNVGMVFDIGSSSAVEVGALPGMNGALAFGVGNGGHVVGSSMMNQGSGTPFIWTQGGGMVAIPFPAGTTQGSARAVNSTGWAVGTASSAFAIPFLYDGTNTYRLADLIPAGTGWDLSTNTSSSALGISDARVIVGTGVFNGATHAYAMVPVAANVSVSGRVLTAGGLPMRGATLTITGNNLPIVVNAQTGSFGWYTFSGLQPGQTYTITVNTKRGVFAQSSQMITPQADVTNFNFVALP